MKGTLRKPWGNLGRTMKGTLEETWKEPWGNLGAPWAEPEGNLEESMWDPRRTSRKHEGNLEGTMREP